MFEDVELKIKKKNLILFSRESRCLQELRFLIAEQKHRTLVLWAFDCASRPLGEINVRYPDESRPGDALRLCRQWAQGEIRMPAAKRAILACHAVAKEISDPVYVALCHAVGQACSTVHVETHALGLPIEYSDEKKPWFRE